MGMGIISLHDENENMVATHPYHSTPDRKLVIDAWRKIYVKGFNNCSLHILPNSQERKVKDNGENAKREE